MDDTSYVPFIRETAFAVVASVDSSGAPQAAGVKIAASDDGQLIFGTAAITRKAENIAGDPRVAVVVNQPGASLQIEGGAQILSGTDLASGLEIYLAAFPDEKERMESAEAALIRITPTWQRMTDYRQG